jgi:hypothetical protein
LRQFANLSVYLELPLTCCLCKCCQPLIIPTWDNVKHEFRPLNSMNNQLSKFASS